MLTDFMNEYERRIKKFAKENDSIFIYGNGVYSKLLQSYFNEEQIKINGIFVSRKGENSDPMVIEYDFEKYKDVKIIMGVKEKNQSEIIANVLPSSENILCLPDKYFRILKFVLSVKTKDKNNNWIYLGYKKTLEYLENGSETILFRRQRGLGDVLNAEPTCKAVKEKGYRVGFITDYPELFYYNNSVDYVVMDSIDPIDRIRNTIYISLLDAHETNPFQHMALSYYKRTKRYIKDIKIREKFIPDYDENLVKPHPLNGKKICMNGEATNWKTRIYDLEKMREFALYLKANGYEIYEVGSDKRNYLGIGKDCFGLDLHNSVEVMSQTDLYVGLDNGLMHLAQAVRLPIFVLFGCTCPLYRIHDWSIARVMWKNIDELKCAGCYHRQRIPCFKTECMYEKCYCLDWSVEEVIYAFENLIYNNPPILHQEMLRPIWS